MAEDIPPWEDPPSLGWDANEDGVIDEYEKNVPEPLVVRGVLLTLVGLVAGVTGFSLDIAWLEQVVAAYGVLMPLGLAVWARRHVSPIRNGGAAARLSYQPPAERQ